MRGGSRYGAGRPALHAKTSQTIKLDVRELVRRGWLQLHAWRSLKWSSGASIGYRVDDGGIRVSYCYSGFSDGKRDIEQHVAIERSPCNYGGTRAWFRCPRCWRRVAVIYLRGWPSCRTCARLVYPSQSEDALARSWRRTGKIEGWLTGGAEKWNFRRLKGMRRATFDRLQEAYWREEKIRDDALTAFIARHGWPLG